jgi:hypothetical protein
VPRTFRVAGRAVQESFYSLGEGDEKEDDGRAEA